MLYRVKTPTSLVIDTYQYTRFNVPEELQVIFKDIGFNYGFCKNGDLTLISPDHGVSTLPPNTWIIYDPSAETIHKKLSMCNNDVFLSIYEPVPKEVRKILNETPH